MTEPSGYDALAESIVCEINKRDGLLARKSHNGVWIEQNRKPLMAITFGSDGLDHKVWLGPFNNEYRKLEGKIEYDSENANDILFDLPELIDRALAQST